VVVTVPAVLVKVVNVQVIVPAKVSVLVLFTVKDVPETVPSVTVMFEEPASVGVVAARLVQESVFELNVAVPDVVKSSLVVCRLFERVIVEPPTVTSSQVMPFVAIEQFADKIKSELARDIVPAV
jgi:hypothetical protein